MPRWLAKLQSEGRTVGVEGPFCAPGTKIIISAAPSVGAHSEGMCVQNQGEGLRADALELEHTGLSEVGKSSVQPRDSSKLLCRVLVKKGWELIHPFGFRGLCFHRLIVTTYSNFAFSLTPVSKEDYGSKMYASKTPKKFSEKQSLERKSSYCLCTKMPALTGRRKVASNKFLNTDGPKAPFQVWRFLNKRTGKLEQAKKEACWDWKLAPIVGLPMH